MYVSSNIAGPNVMMFSYNIQISPAGDHEKFSNNQFSKGIEQ